MCKAKVRLPPIADVHTPRLHEHVANRLTILALCCVASSCAAQQSSRLGGHTATEQTEAQYPLGGFLFTGPADALDRLRQYGEAAGLSFSSYGGREGPPGLRLSGDAAFAKLEVVMDLVNKAQAGHFGDVRLGLLSEPPQP